MQEPNRRLPSNDINDIMVCLGEIKGQLKGVSESMVASNFKVILALIGVIAAQIGVKVLGTPVLLDIATWLAIIGVVSLVAILFFGVRLSHVRTHLTRSGWALVAMMLGIIATQACVYFRELQLLSSDFVYVVRILQNTAILVFCWNIISERHLYHDESNGATDNCKKTGK